MKNNDKIKADKLEKLRLIIWFNLFIGIYNINVFNNMNSIFHLVLGSINIAVWVFLREKYLNFSFSKIFELNKKHRKSI